MRPMPDATTALLHTLGVNLVNFTPIFEEVRSRNWASVTFTGARHEVTFRIEGPGAPAAADAFLANLSCAEFSMRGHIMADIALVSDERRDGEDVVRLSLEALTVEDD